MTQRYESAAKVLIILLGVFNHFGRKWVIHFTHLLSQPSVEHPRLDLFASQRKDIMISPSAVDVDESFDLYAYLKSKKMVNGVPVIVPLVVMPSNTEAARLVAPEGA